MKYKKAIVILAGIIISLDFMQVSVFANAKDVYMICQESLSMNSSEEVQESDSFDDEEDGILEEESIMETEASAQDVIKNKIISYVSGLNGSFTLNYYKNGVYKCKECCAFCNQVWFNTLGIDYYDTSKITKIDKSYSSTSALITFLNSNARPGDALWGKGGHNMLLLGWDSGGIYISDGTSKGKVWHNNGYISFSGNEWKNYYKGYFSAGYRLYHINDSVYNSFATQGDTISPIISNVTVTDHDNTGYTVNCIVTDDSGIEKVEFPTWTDKNGQDDIFWRGGDSVGTETYRAVSFRVNISEHNNEEGWYNTHIYAWDKNGNKVSYGLREYIDLTPPVISDITVTDIGVDGYTVSCTVTDGCPISRVQFPTWTLINGQDDIIHDWTTDPAARGSQSGTRYTYRVQRSAHNYEIYNYITHIYAYDSSGNYSSATVAPVVCLLGNYQNIGADFEAGIQNVATGSYITQDMDSNVTGRKYTGAIGQKWHFTLLEDGSYRILAMQNGSALDCWGGAVNETNIASAPYHGGDNQRWYLYGNEEEGYYFLPKNSLGCGMSLYYTSAAEGTNVMMWNIVNGCAQRFFVKKTVENKNDENIGNLGGSTTSAPSGNGQTTGGNGASANFVSRMYTVALGRNAESAGLSDWCNRLNSGQIDGAGIAQGFIGSPEFKNRNLNNSDFLDVLYKTFFDRPADAQGKSDWLSKLNTGMSREEVLSGFVNSAEFSNLCDRFGIARGTMQKNGSSIYRIGVRNFVLRMYTKVLNRNGETLGVEDWTNRINTGSMSPEDVAKSFFLSREFINRNLSNAEYVETLYETFMDRAFDKEGKRYWLNKLNGGMSREQVLEGFSRSVEFSRIMRSYGL